MDTVVHKISCCILLYCYSSAPAYYSWVKVTFSLLLSMMLKCYVSAIAITTKMSSRWKHWRWSISNYHLLGVILPETVMKFFAATLLPSQATTRFRLPMAQLCWSTATWRGPTVEEREAGWRWPTTTWLTHPVSVLLALELRQLPTQGSASKIIAVLDVVPCCLNHLD